METAVANINDGLDNPYDSPIGEKVLTEDEDTMLCVVDMMVYKSRRGLVCKSMVRTALMDCGLNDLDILEQAVKEIEAQGVRVHLR